MSIAAETAPLRSGTGSTHTDLSNSLTNIAKQAFISNFVFISGMPYGLVRKERKERKRKKERKTKS
jgi:hypothetical protein